jgi:hypothetical protein
LRLIVSSHAALLKIFKKFFRLLVEIPDLAASSE